MTNNKHSIVLFIPPNLLMCSYWKLKVCDTLSLKASKEDSKND